MIAYHYDDFSATQQLAAQWEAQLKADVNLYYSDNMAMVYSNSTPSPSPFYSNGSEGNAMGNDQYGDQVSISYHAPACEFKIWNKADFASTSLTRTPRMVS